MPHRATDTADDATADGAADLPTGSPRRIAVFAHDEARRIGACLDSIADQIGPGDTCHVLANGCTDDTVAVVRRYADDAPWCVPVEIERGDKADAWNLFCHEIVDGGGVYAFVDGDCTLEPGALAALDAGFAERDGINAVAATPSPSVAPKLRRAMLEQGGLAGNLYALAGDFVARVRRSAVRMPIGLVGEDSFVGALACWDLDPAAGWDSDRVHTSPHARFAFERPSMLSASELVTYYRRKRRYALRAIENRMVGELAVAGGLEALPATVDELYALSSYRPPLASAGPDAWFDLQAARRVRRARAARRNAGAGARPDTHRGPGETPGRAA